MMMKMRSHDPVMDSSDVIINGFRIYIFCYNYVNVFSRMKINYNHFIKLLFFFFCGVFYRAN